MRDLSVKGVARRYENETGDISVRNDLMDGWGSLRDQLEDTAREEVSFSMSECIFGWDVAYQQVWTHITVRIQLNPDAGISNATMQTLRNRWEPTIEGRWSDNWATRRRGELSCPFTFEVQWNVADSHHTVRVRPGPARSNMTTWDTNDTGAVAAHEYGHMIGHEDEYQSNRCPNRSPVNTGTIMDNNSANIPARLITPYANRLGTNLQSA